MLNYILCADVDLLYCIILSFCQKKTACQDHNYCLSLIKSLGLMASAYSLQKSNNAETIS